MNILVMADSIPEIRPELLKEILDSCFDEISISNAQGVVIYINNACEKHYGVKPSEIIGKDPHSLAEKKYWEPRLSPIVLKEKRRITIEQKTCLGKTLLTTATPLFNSSREIELVVENSRDITESAGIAEDLERTKELLKRYEKEVCELRKNELSISDYVIKSSSMKNIMQQAQQVAKVDSLVLLLGESGTGKGMVAKFIHNQGPQKDGPFIAINCASLPATLIEAELFGYTKGSFTGAEKTGKIGLIDLASEGTLFLDEIAEVPVTIQAKLLQVLQENQYYEVGGRKLKNVNCKIIAAANRNLKTMIKEGTFREDLYYRLSVFEITIPPLRQRKEDIIPLVHYFQRKFDQKYGQSHEISPKCLETLAAYSWPGNVRELENTLERLIVMVQDNVIDCHHIPKHFHKTSKVKQDNSLEIIPLDDALSELERNLVQKAYKQLGSSYQVAQALKTSQSRASRLIRQYCVYSKT